MKIVAKVGDVSLVVDGLDMTYRQIRKALLDVAGIAASLQAEEPERQALGFAVTTERADPPEPEAWFSDDDE